LRRSRPNASVLIAALVDPKRSSLVNHAAEIERFARSLKRSTIEKKSMFPSALSLVVHLHDELKRACITRLFGRIIQRRAKDGLCSFRSIRITRSPDSLSARLLE
jgi:hypothetical protein